MTLDASPRDHFRAQLDRDIADDTIFQEGWSLHVRRYDIPFPAINGETHTSIEIHGPERPDGTRFYASVDTNVYVGENTTGLNSFLSFVPYKSGLEMRMTTDNNRDGNWVVTDDNLVEDTIIYSGSGPETMLRFAQIAEQAMEFNSSGADYARYSDDANGVERASSNSGPVQILENLGYDVSALRRVDIGDGYNAPGANDDVSSLFPITEPGFFEALSPEAAAALTDPDSQAYQALVTMMEQLHPDYIAEHGPDNLPAPETAPQP